MKFDLALTLAAPVVRGGSVLRAPDFLLLTWKEPIFLPMLSLFSCLGLLCGIGINLRLFYKQFKVN